MRIALVVIPLTLLLAGCDQGKRHQFAACQMEAARVYSVWGNVPLGPDLSRENGREDDYTALCMQTKGYEINYHLESCKGETIFSEQLACYEPVNRESEFWDWLSKSDRSDSN